MPLLRELQCEAFAQEGYIGAQPFFGFLHYRPFWTVAAYTLIFSRADALMVGVICALLLRDPKMNNFIRGKRWIAEASCTMFGFGGSSFYIQGLGNGINADELCCPDQPVE